MKKDILLSEILSYILKKNYSIKNHKKMKITGIAPISSAKHGEISFCSALGEEGLKKIKESNASVILCHTSLKNNVKTEKPTLIFVKNPRLWFFRCIKKFFQSKKMLKGIHPTAIVETKLIGKDVYIGPYCYIGRSVSIGDNTIIYSHVSISAKTYIGNNVTIKPSTVIGYDGSSFERNEKGIWEKLPQVGNVIIEDNVNIGANCCIDAAAIGQTKIGKGTMLDNLIHIAHGVQIGKNCIVTPGCIFAGSCHIGDNVFLSMGTIIVDKGIKVGKNSILGVGSVVTKNIPVNSVAIGAPARVISSRKNYDQTSSPRKIIQDQQK